MTTPVLEQVVLHGERVSLRPVSVEDAEAAFTILHRRKEVLRWLVWEGPESREELESSFGEWVRRAPEGDNYLLAICDLETEAYVGSIGPRFRGHPGRGDIGYWLAPEYWGRGFATEALHLVSHLCFRHLGAKLLYAQAFLGNVGSRVVLERNGFKMERVLRDAVLKGGKRQDEWYFELDRAGWLESNDDWQPTREDVALAPED